MELDNNLNDSTDYSEYLDSDIFDLVIGRVLKRVYLNLDEQERNLASKIFLSDKDEEKENFIKKNIPNFEEIFKEELQKIEEEIKAEVEKQA